MADTPWRNSGLGEPSFEGDLSVATAWPSDPPHLPGTDVHHNGLRQRAFLHGTGGVTAKTLAACVQGGELGRVAPVNRSDCDFEDFGDEIVLIEGRSGVSYSLKGRATIQRRQPRANNSLPARLCCRFPARCVFCRHWESSAGYQAPSLPLPSEQLARGRAGNEWIVNRQAAIAKRPLTG